MTYKEFMVVAVDVDDGVDLEELFEAGCPFVKLLPAKYVLDRDTVVQAIRDGRQDALPNGVTFTVSSGYAARSTK